MAADHDSDVDLTSSEEEEEEQQQQEAQGPLRAGPCVCVACNDIHEVETRLLYVSNHTGRLGRTHSRTTRQQTRWPR
jgi:hypothetical protein